MLNLVNEAIKCNAGLVIDGETYDAQSLAKLKKLLEDEKLGLRTPPISLAAVSTYATVFTPESAARMMRARSDMRGHEDPHIEMDDLMCQILEAHGYTEAVGVFKSSPRFYS